MQTSAEVILKLEYCTSIAVAMVRRAAGMAVEVDATEATVELDAEGGGEAVKPA